MKKVLNAIEKYESVMIAALFTWLLLISFVNERIYEVLGRYSSLVIFIVLCLILLPYLKKMILKRDIRVFAAAAVGIISMTNLILLHSNKGAVLIPTDLSLIVLVISYAELSEKVRIYMAAAGSILTIIWYVDVRWSYNFNMAGLTFMLFMIMGVIFMEYLKEKKGYPYLAPVQVIMYVTAFIYASLYHSRCAMAGILVFGICTLLGRYILRDRVFFTILLILLTVGSIVFTFAYVMLASRNIHVTFLYKDLLSGRQEIWKELWGAFNEHPFTGIGSSYELKSFEIFEVHNGLFDILTVHGLIVFTLVFLLLVSAANEAWLFAREDRKVSQIPTLAFAAVFAMLMSSFFENFFIVPPYSVYFLYFLMLCRGCKKNAAADGTARN